MQDISKYWLEIEEGLFVIKSEGLEDFRAVVGSKTSRASDLNIKSNIDKEGIEKFLSLNLAGYGHASIGEMSFPTVHHRGFGWVSAWLIEDDPLFVGQEVSTRAVDMRDIPNSQNICYDAPKFLQKYHAKFWEIFDELNKKNLQNKGYKFDNIRWALPGTTKVGVTCMMNARAAIRHLERLLSIPFVRKCSENFLKGIKECSPYVFAALSKGQRNLQHRWRKLEKVIVRKRDIDFNNSIIIEAPKDLDNMEAYKKMKNILPRNKKDYLDPFFKSLTPFKVKIICSIAAARDWHRHRPVMPWNIKLVLDENNQPFIAPWYNLEGNEKEITKYIYESSNECNNIIESENSLQALYSLPYGCMVELECNASLPDLLYMLELRASAGGNNFEYRSHAVEGLKQLIKIMGNEFTSYHSLDNILKEKN